MASPRFPLGIKSAIKAVAPVGWKPVQKPCKNLKVKKPVIPTKKGYKKEINHS